MGITYGKGIKRPDEFIQPTQEQLKEIIKCGRDPIYFAENYYYIVHPTKGKHKINLWNFQKRLIRNFRNNQKNVVLSARQVGKTTCSSLFLLWVAIFNEDQHIGILANKQKTAKSIVDDVKVAYQMLPDWMKPGVVKYNDLSIEFDNGTKIEASATSADSFRGESLSLLFLDEFAFVPENVAEDFWRSTYPAVASNSGSVIVVSTPNGAAGKFYELYTSAESQRNDFVPFKVDWDEVPGRDEEWKRETIKEFGQIAFQQEFNCSFTGSSMTLIDGDILASLQNKVKEAPFVFEDGGYQIWKRPETGRIYAFGVDISQGTHGDYSIVNIFDVTDYHETGQIEQVGLWRRNDVRIFDFASKVLDLTKEWFDPLVIIENNSGLAETLIQQLHFEEGYEHLYFDYAKGDYGINANKRTKPAALGFFKEDVEEGKIKINSQELVRELGIFEEVGRSPSGEKKYAARKGRSFHDDVVAATYWISYMLRDNWFQDAYEYRLEQMGKDPKSVLEESIRDEETLDIFNNALGVNHQSELDAFERELMDD